MRSKHLSRTVILLLLFLISGFFAGCKTNKPIRIALSRSSNNYVNWLMHSDTALILIDLDSLPAPEALKALKECSGLLLTGGEDVYPGLYGKEYDTIRCTEMNPLRDSLEIILIARALEMKMPIFGICRGHQILNVYLGGINIIDIPKDFDTMVIHQCADYLHCFHKVNTIPKSQLALISQCDSAEVTTNHHQGVESLAPLLRASAFAGDGLIEGIEWADPEGKSFLMGVQWHPERMKKTNPLSGTLADKFIKKAYLFSSLHNKK